MAFALKYLLLGSLNSALIGSIFDTVCSLVFPEENNIADTKNDTTALIAIIIIIIAFN